MIRILFRISLSLVSLTVLLTSILYTIFIYSRFLIYCTEQNINLGILIYIISIGTVFLGVTPCFILEYIWYVIINKRSLVK